MHMHYCSLLGGHFLTSLIQFFISPPGSCLQGAMTDLKDKLIDEFFN